MKITTFEISEDRKTIYVNINDALFVNKLVLWTDKTYKDSNLGIDLFSFLRGKATESFKISLLDLNLPYFDGVYFLEATSNVEISTAVTADLTRYKECILNKVLKIVQCNDCLKIIDNDILNAYSLLYSLETAVSSGFIDEIILIVEALNKYCSNKCKSCGEYLNILDTNYYKNVDLL